MITWYHNTDLVYHSYQLASVGLSTVIIAKSCADHHYFETRGKSVRGELSATVCPVGPETSRGFYEYSSLLALFVTALSFTTTAGSDKLKALARVGVFSTAITKFN